MIFLDNVSVIIPTRVDDTTWKDLLENIHALVRVAEVIVVIPTLIEEEATQFTAKYPNLKILTSALGRGTQLNTGAQVAVSKYLWFLHGDSKLSSESVLEISKLTNQPNQRALYYFKLKYLNDGPLLMRINEVGARLRSSLLGIPFGDQGFFISKQLFKDLGGYDENTKYGEDHLFVWQCKKHRVSLICLNANIFSSARKYVEHGWFKTTLLHVSLTIKQILAVLLERQR